MRLAHVTPITASGSTGLAGAPGAESAPQARPLCLDYDPDVWYPEDDDMLGVVRARDICRQCPIQAECCEEALARREPFGIWGGLTPRERAVQLAIRDRARQRVASQTTA